MEFFKDNAALLERVRVMTVRDDGLAVHAVRCDAIEALYAFLHDRIKVAALPGQHDMVLAIMAMVILKDTNASINVRSTAGGPQLDLVSMRKTYELKTACNVGDGDIGPLVAGHLDEMHASHGRKETWLVAFWRHRATPPQGILGGACTEYLFVVEIAARLAGGDPVQRATLTGKVASMVQEVEERACEEDEVIEGFLVPTKNVWIVDKLRRECQVKDEVIAENKEALAEKDEALAEKDEALAEKDEALAEKDEALAEKDRIIAELRRKLGEK